MNWYLVWWNVLVPEPLLKAIMRHLTEHEGPKDVEVSYSLVEPDDLHVLDYPGPCSMNRNLHDIHVSGLHLQIPSTDFSALFQEVKGLPLSKEGGIPHYRFYSMVRCLCLTSELRDELLQEMGKQMSAAVEIADWENHQFNEALGGVTQVRLETDDTTVTVPVLETPRAHGVLLRARPVIDRDIDEA